MLSYTADLKAIHCRHFSTRTQISEKNDTIQNITMHKIVSLHACADIDDKVAHILSLFKAICM